MPSAPGQFAGAALRTACRPKERAYPELVHARCRLVVLAIELGGRWHEPAAEYARAGLVGIVAKAQLANGPAWEARRA